MIISVSRRTDIPAFYGPWFMNRIRAGFARVANPFNPKSIFDVSLRPEEVDALVFWTKNVGPFLSCLDELDDRGYRYYFQYTLTPYGRELEPRVPDLEERVRTFSALADRLSPGRVIWRYDPIILSDRTSFEFHARSFLELAKRLSGKTERVMISFLSWYRKTKRRMGALESEGWRFDEHAADHNDAEPFLATLAESAAGCGMKLFTCADGHDYTRLGIGQGSCIDADLIRDLWGILLKPGKDKGQREFCRCAPSRDIGAADTCVHGCLYCYSTVSDAVARQRCALHDPKSPILRPGSR